MQDVEGRLGTLEGRMDSAALIVRAIQGDVRQLQQLLTAGETIGAQQQSALKESVSGIAGILTERDPSRNHYQGVWPELNRWMAVARYRDISAEQFAEAMSFLEQRHRELVSSTASGR